MRKKKGKEEGRREREKGMEIGEGNGKKDG